MSSDFIENDPTESRGTEDPTVKVRKRMLWVVPVFITVIILGISTCHNYGRRTHLDHLTVYNTGSVSDSLADKFLSFFNNYSENSNDISIQLDLENGRYKVKAPVTSASVIKDYSYTQEFSAMARLISDSVFNSLPTDFVATDEHFNPIGTFPMEMTFLLDSLKRLHKNDKYIGY